ncbi:hypothetical protein PFLUV_G00007040 [Perca fluviatilis]|uniref:Uncharacterized protein n=1 Tax=Perca fluviatilis TaxID=8168 RepID=A0A6A5FQ14_PERFL|nr:hypothetical protein PFLUV_G00007040 [Perca fluviatilis]
MIKPRGPSQAASEPEPSLQESTLPAENQLALVTKAPNLRHLHCSAKWRDEPLFSFKVSLGRNGKEVPPSDQGRDGYALCLAACFIPTGHSCQRIPPMRRKI